MDNHTKEIKEKIMAFATTEEKEESFTHAIATVQEICRRRINNTENAVEGVALSEIWLLIQYVECMDDWERVPAWARHVVTYGIAPCTIPLAGPDLILGEAVKQKHGLLEHALNGIQSAIETI